MQFSFACCVHSALLSPLYKRPWMAAGERFKRDPTWCPPPPKKTLSVMSPYSSCGSSCSLAVLQIPSRLLPSNSSCLARPQSSVSTRSINSIVRKQWGLFILTWMDMCGVQAAPLLWRTVNNLSDTLLPIVIHVSVSECTLHWEQSVRFVLTETETHSCKVMHSVG